MIASSAITRAHKPRDCAQGILRVAIASVIQVTSAQYAKAIHTQIMMLAIISRGALGPVVYVRYSDIRGIPPIDTPRGTATRRQISEYRPMRLGSAGAGATASAGAADAAPSTAGSCAGLWRAVAVGTAVASTVVLSAALFCTVFSCTALLCAVFSGKGLPCTALACAGTPGFWGDYSICLLGWLVWLSVISCGYREDGILHL